MKIKLNVDYTVCLDGIHPTAFHAGEETDMPIHIVQVLLADGRASLSEGVKAEGPAPENKMLSGSPEDKGRFRRKKR